MEDYKEEPVEIASLSRVKHKKWDKGKKADIVICCNENPGWSDKVKCKECGDVCYYTSKENLDIKKKNIKRICLKCGLTKYRKFLNKEQIKILEFAL